MVDQHVEMNRLRRVRSPWLLLAVLALTVGCAGNRRNTVPPGTTQPDQFLFDRGNALLKDRKWVTSREFFKQLTETYTQSPLRPDAKLAIGDSYLGEGSGEALVLAQNEFQEFLSFYPTHPRADYAQYKLAMTHFRQMRAPQRDQSETRDTIRDLQAFVTRYPNSSLMPEVRTKLREARDRLGAADYEVGVFYFRQRWYPGAVDRLSTLIKGDPEFTGRDGAYFYLGESLMKLSRPAEALPFYEKVIAEFKESEYLEDARKRVDTVKAEMAAKGLPPATAAPATATAPPTPATTSPPATPATGTPLVANPR
jgi:outer membrane protein assembly factor BamD